jgi:ketosteroid isomerase-like protein
MRRLVLILGAFAALFVVKPALAANNPAAEKAVLAALDAWKEAMVKKDAAALEKIFHPDLTYAHSSATIETKAQAISHLMASPGFDGIDFSETTVRLQGNVALVNGKTDMHQRNKDKPTTISKLIVLTVWVKGKPGWQMIARQAVRRPDDDQVIAAKAAVAAMSGKTPAAKPAAAPPK